MILSTKWKWTSVLFLYLLTNLIIPTIPALFLLEIEKHIVV
jgi:hypothetical protein